MQRRETFIYNRPAGIRRYVVLAYVGCFQRSMIGGDVSNKTIVLLLRCVKKDKCPAKNHRALPVNDQSGAELKIENRNWLVRKD